MQQKVISIWLAGLALVILLMSSCGSFATQDLKIESAKAAALCIEGHGPPLTGSGHVTFGKVDRDFRGRVSVSPDCALELSAD